MSIIKKKITAYTDFNSGKYTVLMYRKISNRYVRIDKVKLNIKEQKFRYKMNDFINFDRNAILFSDEKNNYYGFDFDTKEQLSMSNKELPKSITLAEIDRYVNQGLIRQLSSDLEKPKSDKREWIMFLIGAVCGGFGGFIIAQIVMTGGF